MTSADRLTISFLLLLALLLLAVITGRAVMRKREQLAKRLDWNCATPGGDDVVGNIWERL